MTGDRSEQDLLAQSDDQLDRITASFENEHAQARRRAIWLSFIPIVVGLLVVGSAWLSVSSAQRERAEVEAAMAKAEQSRKTLRQENKILQDEIAEKRAELEYVASLLEQGKTDLAQQAAEKVEAAPRAETRPRIYIHVSDEKLVPVVRKVAEALRKKNFIVPKEEILVDTMLSTSQVRYFREQEREQAEAIARLMEAGGVESVEAVHIGGYEDSTAIKPGHFEIWLSTP